MTDDTGTNSITGAELAAPQPPIPPAAAASTTAVETLMPATPAPIKGFFANLISEIEAIPGEVTAELGMAKSKIMMAIGYVDGHFQIAKTAAATDAAAIKTDATDVQAAVEKAV